MANCDYCKSTFEGYAPLKLWVQKSGDDVLFYAQNQGKNIISIYRALLCIEWSTGGTTIIYIREGGPIPFYIKGVLEQGMTYLMYDWENLPTAEKGRAEAEYIEYSGRAVCECTSF